MCLWTNMMLCYGNLSQHQLLTCSFGCYPTILVQEVVEGTYILAGCRWLWEQLSCSSIATNQHRVFWRKYSFFTIPVWDGSDPTLPREPPESFSSLSTDGLLHGILSVIKSILSNLRTNFDKDYGLSVRGGILFSCRYLISI